MWLWVVLLMAALGGSTNAFANEGNLVIPDLKGVSFHGLGGISGPTLMYLGIVICAIGAAFGVMQYLQTKALPVHQNMAIGIGKRDSRCHATWTPHCATP